MSFLDNVKKREEEKRRQQEELQKRMPDWTEAVPSSATSSSGGTSLSAPYWAGIAELVAQKAGTARTGNINTRLYTLGALANTAESGLRNVTKGSNNFKGVKGFKATKGYNKATGWGTPDLAILVPALAAP